MSERKTVLTIEDYDPIRDLIAGLLGTAGYRVLQADNGARGLEIAQRETVDLILLDMMMPGMDGIEVVSRLKADERTKRIPVVMLSGGARTPGQKAAGLDAGADEYLTKPIGAAELLSRIHGVLRTRELAEQISRLGTDRDRECWLLRSQVDDLTLRSQMLALEVNRLSASTESASSKTLTYRDFCSAIAHTLRGEFMHIGNAVPGILSVMHESQEGREECEAISRSLEYCQLQVRRLLDFFEVGGPQLQAFPVTKVVEKIERLVRPRLPSRVSMEVEVDGAAENILVLADMEQVIEVLMELIKNAFNALRAVAGGKVGLRLAREGTELVFTVQDNGPGIPQDILPRLLKQPLTSKSGGLGVGLYLCNKAISGLGGKLKVGSSPSGTGTAAEVRIPIAEEQS